MIELIVRHLLVLALAAIVALLLRRRSAALRHSLWTIALILCLALPLLQQVPIGLPPTALPDAFLVQPIELLGKVVVEQAATTELPVPANPLPSLRSLAWAIYLLVAVALAARWAAGWWMAVRLAGNGESLGKFHGTRIVVVPGVGPLTFGWPRATIVIPDASFRDREPVLLHELAHVQRADFIWQALGALATALWWFSPAVWLANRALRSEADRASDDRVLGTGASAPDYADSLLAVASMQSGARRPATALVPLIRRAGLATRIAFILAGGADRRGVRLTAIIAMAALLVPAGLFVSHETLAASEVVESSSQDIPARSQMRGRWIPPGRSATPQWAPPRDSLQGKRIVLDPGHGGKDPGAIKDGQRESDRTLDIALRTADELRRRGAIVTLTRDSDRFVSLEQRAALSEGQDFFLSIHLESRPSVVDAPARQSPLSVYFHSVAGTDEAATAKDIEASIDHAWGTRKTYAPPPGEPEIRRVNVKVLRDAKSPAYMINWGDLDKISDRSRLDEAQFMASLVQALLWARASRATD